jgi:hypothetical protein
VSVPIATQTTTLPEMAVANTWNSGLSVCVGEIV